MSSQVTLASVSSIPVSSGSVNLNIAWTINAPLDVRQQITVGTSFTAVTVPSGASLCVIIPPTTNTNALTLKGVTGDTGIPISPSQPTVIPCVGSTAFGLLATGATIPLTEIVFL